MREIDLISKYYDELRKYLRDWAITDPETTLILGNVNRMMHELANSIIDQERGEVRESIERLNVNYLDEETSACGAVLDFRYKVLSLLSTHNKEN